MLGSPFFICGLSALYKLLPSILKKAAANLMHVLIFYTYIVDNSYMTCHVQCCAHGTVDPDFL